MNQCSANLRLKQENTQHVLSDNFNSWRRYWQRSHPSLFLEVGREVALKYPEIELYQVRMNS